MFIVILCKDLNKYTAPDNPTELIFIVCLSLSTIIRTNCGSSVCVNEILNSYQVFCFLEFCNQQFCCIANNAREEKKESFFLVFCRLGTHLFRELVSKLFNVTNHVRIQHIGEYLHIFYQRFLVWVSGLLNFINLVVIF